MGRGPVTPPRGPGRGSGHPWGESRRRVIPAGLEPRAGVSRPGAHTVGAPGCAGAHPNPKGPGVCHPDDCTTVRAGGSGKAGPRRNLQALGRSGQLLRTGTGVEGGPPNCGGKTTRRPGPAGPVATESDWTANYNGRGRKPASGPLPQDGKRWCRWGVEGAGSHITWPDQGTQVLPASRQRRPGPLGMGTRPGSHHDGQDACSPGEGREDTRSLDGRGRGVGDTLVRLGSFIGPRSESGAALPARGMDERPQAPAGAPRAGECGEEGCSGERPNLRSGRQTRGPPRGAQRATSIQVSLHHKLQPPVRGQCGNGSAGSPLPAALEAVGGRTLAVEPGPSVPGPRD